MRHREIPGTIVEFPATLKPVLAPVSGRIMKVNVLAGSVAGSDSALVQILRDPLPRPTFTLTEEILKFTNEDLHRTAAELRKAAATPYRQNRIGAADPTRRRQRKDGRCFFQRKA